MSKLKIAIQKKGRLHDDSINLLKSCGLEIKNHSDQLKVEVANFPMEVLYLRNSDIPQYLEDGTIDLAIVGENLLIEKQKKVKIVEKLGFSKCRVSLAVPKKVKDQSIQYLNGKKIATSYPVTLKSYLKKNKIEAEIHTITGSVEIAPNIGLADGICDIVSSGSTLLKNGLKEIQVILESEAVLVKSMHLSKDQEHNLDKFVFRVKAVLKAKKYKYILLNVPDDKIKAVAKILPVLESPTILPLAQKGWSSLHSVIKENQLWEVIDELKEAGAKDILIIPIDKMAL